MNECQKCGISGERIRLYEVISDEGIIFMCEDCALKDDLPIIRKPTTFQLKAVERTQTVHERLSRASGVTHSSGTRFETLKEPTELKKQEIGLKSIIEKKFQGKYAKNESPRVDLVENFHWVITQARRRKKASVEQLAREIGESEIAVKMAEEGILPEDDYRLVNKLENALGIRLRNIPIEKEKSKISFEPIEKKTPARMLDFKPEVVKNLTIDDLRRMKKAKDEALKTKNKPESAEIEDGFGELDFEPEEKGL